MKKLAALMLCGIMCAANITAAHADIYESTLGSGETKTIVTAPDCIYINNVRMVKIASYMKYRYGANTLWNAETKTVDFYYDNGNGVCGHLRVKVGSSYVDYSGVFVENSIIRTGNGDTTAYSGLPNQIVDGCVYVDEKSLVNYVLNDTVLKP